MGFIETCYRLLNGTSIFDEEKANARKAKELQEEAEREIQIREWNGEIYVSIQDVPFAKVDSFTSSDVGEILTELRNNYVKYRTKK